MTNWEVSNGPLGKPPSENAQPGKPASDEKEREKPPSDRNLKIRLRARLQVIGGALASIAAVGAIAGGLVGYWTVWKTLRTDVFPESQKTQKQATIRPDVAPRLSCRTPGTPSRPDRALAFWFPCDATVGLPTSRTQADCATLHIAAVADLTLRGAGYSTPGSDVIGVRHGA